MSLLRKVLRALLVAVVAVATIAGPLIILAYILSGLFRPVPIISFEWLATHTANVSRAVIQLLSLVAITFSAAVVVFAVGVRSGARAIQVAAQDVIDFGDYYSLLGVSRYAKVEEIVQAYKRLVKKYHPDVSGHPMAEEIMKAANAAREILTDPVKRRRYDEMLASKKVAATLSTDRKSQHSYTHGRLVCKAFSAIPLLMMALLLVNSVALLPSVLPGLGFSNLLSLEGLMLVSLFLLIAVVASRTVYIMLAGWAVSLLIAVAFFLLVLIPVILYIIGQPFPKAYQPGIEVVITVVLAPLIPLVGGAYLIMQLIIESLRHIDIMYPFIAMSFLSAAAVWWDKRQASLRCWRISEAALKRMAITGGGLAMLLSCLVLRHKIRNSGFILTIITAFVINIITMWLVMR